MVEDNKIYIITRDIEEDDIDKSNNFRKILLFFTDS